MEQTATEGTWVLALRANGQGYLGRVSKLDGVVLKTVDVDTVLAADRIELNPVYDYREIVKDIPILGRDGKMQQDPNMPGLPAMQPMRTPLVMPVGFTAAQAPLHIRPRHYDFRFLDEMDKRDARTLHDFAQSTEDMMAEVRAQATGISIAGPSELEALRKRRGL